MADTSYIMNLIIRAENALNALERFKILSEGIPDSVIIDISTRGNLKETSKAANDFGSSLGLAGEDLQLFVKQITDINSYLSSFKHSSSGAVASFTEMSSTVRTNIETLKQFKEQLLLLNILKEKGIDTTLLPGFLAFSDGVTKADQVVKEFLNTTNLIGKGKGQAAQGMLGFSNVQKQLEQLMSMMPGLGDALYKFLGLPADRSLTTFNQMKVILNNMAQGFSLGVQATQTSEGFKTLNSELQAVATTMTNLKQQSAVVSQNGIFGPDQSQQAKTLFDSISSLTNRIETIKQLTRGGILSGELSGDEAKRLLDTLNMLQGTMKQLEIEQAAILGLSSLTSNEYGNQAAIISNVNAALFGLKSNINDSLIGAQALKQAFIDSGGMSTALVSTSQAVRGLTASELSLLQVQIELIRMFNPFFLQIQTLKSSISGVASPVEQATEVFDEFGNKLTEVVVETNALNEANERTKKASPKATFVDMAQALNDLRAKIQATKNELQTVNSEIASSMGRRKTPQNAEEEALLGRQRDIRASLTALQQQYSSLKASGQQATTTLVNGANAVATATSQQAQATAASTTATSNATAATKANTNATRQQAAAAAAAAAAANAQANAARKAAAALATSTQDLATFSAKGERMFEQINGSVKDFSFFMNIAIEKIIRYRVAFFLLQKGIEVFSNTFSFARQVEAQLAELDRVLINSGSNIEDLKNAAYDLGRTFGVAFKDVIDVMTIWAQQGKTQNEIMALTRTTMVAMVAASLDAKTAVETLTAAQRIYNISAEDSLIVFDKILNVERLYAITTQDLAESIKLLGATAEEFNMSMDELLGSITAIGQVTRRSGSQVANALKTVFANFNQEEVLKMFRDMGLAVNDVFGNIRPMGQILDDLSARWSTFTESQRINIAKSVSGIRHYTSFIVLMDQYAVKLKATADAANSMGTSQQALGKKVNTLDANVKKLSVSFQQMVEAVGKSTFGFANSLGGIIKLLNLGDTSGLNKFQKGFAEAQGALLSFATTIVVVKGIALGYNLALSKASEITANRVLQDTQVMSTTLKKYAGQIDLFSRGLSFQGIAGQLKASPQQIKDAATAIRMIKVGQTATVQLGSEFVMLQKTARGAAVQVAQVGVAASGAAAGMGTAGVAAGGLTAKLGLMAGLGVIFKGLYAALGGWIGIALLAATTALPILLNKFIKGKDVVKEFNETIQNNVTSMLEAVDSQKKYVYNIAILSSQFAHFVSVFNSLGDKPVEQEKAFASLINVFNQLKGLDPLFFGQFTDTSSLRNVENQRKIMTELFKNIEGGAFSYKRLSENTALATQQQISSIKQNIRVIGDLSTSVSEYTRLKEDALRVDIESIRENNQANSVLSATMKQYGKFWQDVSRGRKISFSAALEGQIENIGKMMQALQEQQPILAENVNLIGDYYSSLTSMAAKWENMKNQFTDKDLLDVGFNKKSFETFGNDLEKMAKDIASGKPIDISEMINVESGQNMFEKFAALVRNKMSDEINKLTTLYAELEKQIENIPGALNLTAKEWKKLYDEVASGAAKAIVMFQNLGASIKKEVQSAFFQDKPSTYLDILISQLEQTENKLDDVTISYKEQLKELQISRELIKQISEGQKKLYADDIVSLQEKALNMQKKINETQNKMDAGLIDFEQGRREIALYETALLGFRTSALNTARQIAPTVPSEQLKAMTDSFISQAREGGIISQGAAQIVTDLVGQQMQLYSDEISQLEKKLNLGEQLTASERAQTKEQLKKAREQKAEIALVEKRLELGKENLQLNQNIAKEILGKLEFGEKAVSYVIDQQNVKLKSQEKIWENLDNYLKMAGIDAERINQIHGEITDGSSGWRDFVEEIADGYARTGGSAEDLRKLMEATLSLEEERRESNLKSLEVIKQSASAIEFVTDQTAAYVGKQKKARDLSAEISELLNRRQSVVAIETQKWQDTLDTQQASKQILIDTVNLLVQKKKLTIEEGAAFIEQVKSMNTLQKTNIELFSSRFVEQLEKVKPVLENIKNRASEIAEAFTSSFADMPSIILDRYSSISDASEEIRDKTNEIAKLQRELSNVTIDNAEEYQNLSSEIRNAQTELSRMKDDLQDMSSLKGFLGDIFGNMAKNIADLMAEIQKNEMKTAFEGILNNTKFGENLVSLFTTASEKGAIKYAVELQRELDFIADNMRDVFRIDGQQFIDRLRAVLNETTASLSISNENTDANIASLNDVINRPTNISTPELQASSQLMSIGSGQILVRSDEINKLLGKSNTHLENISNNTVGSKAGADAQSDTSVFLKALVNMFGIQFGTAAGARAFGAKNAAGAGVGSQIGSGLLTAMAKDKELGKYLSAILPVGGALVGGLLGGAISSMFKKKEKPPIVQEKPRPEIKENVSALRENTSAIVGLSNEFVDLRNELINAPGRFSMPNRYNFGQGVLPGTVGSYGQGSGAPNDKAFNVSITVQGNMDSNVGEQVVQQIATIYSRQSRQNSSNSRMPR